MSQEQAVKPDRRRAVVVATAGALLLVAAILAFSWPAVKRRALERVRTAAQAVLAGALNGRVEIGELELRGPTTAVARDVRVYLPGETEPVISAPLVEVDYSIPLRRGFDPVELIRRIRIDSPELLLVMDREGRFNLERLLKPGAAVGPGARLFIEIEVSRASVETRLDLGAERPLVFAAHGLHIQARLQPFPLIRLEARGGLDGDILVREFDVEGLLDLGRWTSTFQLVAEGVDAAALGRFLPAEAGVQMIGGVLDIEASISGDPRRLADPESLLAQTVRAGARGRVAAIHAALGDEPFETDFEIDYGDGALAVAARALLGGPSPVTVELDGRAWTEPSLRWRASARVAGLDAERLRGRLPEEYRLLSGVADLELKAHGSELGAEAELLMRPRALVYDRRHEIGLELLELRALFGPDRIDITSITGVLDGSGFRGSGAVWPARPLEAAVTLELAPVALGAHKQLLPPEAAEYLLDAELGGSAVVRWLEGRGFHALARVNADLDLVRGVSQHVAATLKYADDTLYLQSAAAGGGLGQWMASGLFRAGAYELRADGVDLPVSWFEGLYPLPAAASELDLSRALAQVGVRASGKAGEAPEVGIDLALTGGGYGSLEINGAWAELEVTDRGVEIALAEVFVEGARVTAAGQVDRTGRLHIEAAVPALALERWAPRLAADAALPQVRGELAVSGLISGTVDAPRFDFRAGSEAVYLAGELMGGVEARLSSRQDDNLDLFARVRRGDQVFEAEGWAGLDGELEVAVRLDNVSPGPWVNARQRLFAVGGTLTGRGLVRGSVREPSVVLELESTDPSANGVDFNALWLRAAYERGTAVVEDLVVCKGFGDSPRDCRSYAEPPEYGGRLRISGALELESMQMDVTAWIQNADTRTFVDLVDSRTAMEFSGRLSGEARVWGRADELLGALGLTGADLVLGGYPIDTLSLEVNYRSRAVELVNFEAENRDSVFFGHGVLDLDDLERSTIDLNAHNVDLDAASSLLGLRRGLLRGYATLNIFVGLADADAASPVHGSIFVDGVRFGPLSAGPVTGLFDVRADSLALRSFNAAVGGGVVQASGSIPIPTRPADMDRRRLELEITGRDIMLDRQSLELPAGVDAGGLVNLELAVGGSLRSPTVQGLALIHGGYARHPDLRPGLEDVSGRIVFEPGRIEIPADQDLIGRMGESPIHVRGFAEVADMALGRYDFVVSGRAVPLAYSRMFSGGLDLDFGLTGRGSRALIKGNVTMNSGELMLMAPQVGDMVREGPPPPVELDIQIHTRRYLLVKAPPGLRIDLAVQMAAGPDGIHVRGPLTAPVIDGRLVSAGGRMVLFNNEFEIDEDSFVQFRWFRGFMPELNFTARSLFVEPHVGDVNVTVVMQGPMDDLALTVDSDLPLRLGETRAEREARALAVITHQANIEGLLEGGQARSILEHEARAFVGVWAVNPLQRAIERELGFSKFEVRLDPYENILLDLERSITDRLSVKYTHLFAIDEEQIVELRYRFRGKNFISWQIDEDKEHRLGVEYRFRF